MQYNVRNITIMALSLLALSACKEEDIDYSLPTLVPIDMTVGLESTNNAVTRVITTPVDNKMILFNNWDLTYNGGGYANTGTIDLSDSYIKINDTVVQGILK